MLNLQTAASQPIRIKLPRLHAAQQEIKRAMLRFNIARCGRQFGKDVLGQDRTAIKAGYQHQALAWCAPSYRMLSDNFRMFADTLWPIITRKLDNERIDLIGGGYIEFWSLEQADRVRGHHYHQVVINEAAMVKRLKQIVDVVIIPTLFRYQGGLDLYSTPRGLNDFFTLWRQAESDPAWARFHRTTYDNPHIPRAEIERTKTSVPERVFNQEILADFVEDGAFFQNIEKAAILAGKETPEQHQGHTFFLAADWGKSNDWSVFGVGCRECARVVDWERFKRIDYIYQRERLNSLNERWKPREVLPERNSMGEPNVELLIQSGLPVMNGPDGKPGFYTSPASKPPAIEGLAQAFILHNFQVPAEASEELLAYEVNILPSGHNQFSAPDGQHDDWVMMLALLWWAMLNTRPYGGIHA